MGAFLPVLRCGAPLTLADNQWPPEDAPATATSLPPARVGGDPAGPSWGLTGFEPRSVLPFGSVSLCIAPMLAPGPSVRLVKARPAPWCCRQARDPCLLAPPPPRPPSRVCRSCQGVAQLCWGCSGDGGDEGCGRPGPSSGAQEGGPWSTPFPSGTLVRGLTWQCQKCLISTLFSSFFHLMLANALSPDALGNFPETNPRRSLF